MSKGHFHQGTESLKGQLWLYETFLQPHTAESELKTPAVSGFEHLNKVLRTRKLFAKIL